MVGRSGYSEWVEKALGRSPVVMIVGPRQCGKTTLARSFLSEKSDNYFDLENPLEARLLENPMTTLSPLRGLVVIDEAQRAGEIFPVLRVLADREGCPAQFLVLGSASPELIRQGAESLAGRVELIELRGFSLAEVGGDAMDRLWHRGAFPNAFLAQSEEDSYAWRENFVRTFLQRDLASLGFGMSPAALGRFWVMLSHYHGQVWNGNELASALGVSGNTVRGYLDALEQTFMVRRLRPWFENVGKRVVKSPKVYLRDSGIFHALQGIEGANELWTHPKIGASWEGFALEEVLAAAAPREAYFYAIHSGSELDLFFIKKGKRIGVEFKREDAPSVTRSMRIAIEDLRLDALWVVYPGERVYALDDLVKVLPLAQVHEVKWI